MEYRIRQAAPADADALVRMHTLAHEECYGSQLSAAFFASRRASIPERVERRRPYLRSSEPRLIALDADDAVVGFADAGASRDADRPGELELFSIYTLRRTYGSGLGTALLDAAVADLPAFLWVLEENPRARAFYARHGFRPDGQRKRLPAEWSELPEIRLVRPAPPR